MPRLKCFGSMWIVLVFGALVLTGCGGCDDDDMGDDGGTTVDGSMTLPDRRGSTVRDCEDSDDCDDGQVCHPFRDVCVVPGAACETHEECPEGFYCEASLGVCLTGSTGAPCEEDDNCEASCTGGFCGCDGLEQEQMLMSLPLDVYLILDRTGSMGQDCAYDHGDEPPVNSKACFATYALSDYLIDVEPEVETRLAFQFMSQPSDCNGNPYRTPLVDLTRLPVAESHEIIEEISDETFAGGLGTHIEGALRGLALYTSDHQVPNREIIGVLMTDGDPNGCENDISDLRDIIADHLKETGIRTFIIGMEGATEENLEELALAGGAEPHDDYCGDDVDPPCHYWNVGDGSGDAIEDALQAIIQMAVPLPCSFSVADLEPPEGETLDYRKVNVNLTQGDTTTTIGQVPNEAACPTDQNAWYYDNPEAPTEIHLCPTACELVSEAGDGARISVVVGCSDTIIII